MSLASGVLHAPCPTAAGAPQPLPALLQPAPGVPEVPGEAALTRAPGTQAPALHPRASPPPSPLCRSGGSSLPSSSSGPWDSASFSTCSSCILGHLGGGWGVRVSLGGSYAGLVTGKLRLSGRGTSYASVAGSATAACWRRVLSVAARPTSFSCFSSVVFL